MNMTYFMCACIFYAIDLPWVAIAFFALAIMEDD